MKSAKFSPYDSLVYDVFGLFQCKLSKTGNLLLFHINSHKDEDAGHLRCTETCKTRKVVAHSSGLQKLKNSNLKILKFEARFAYAAKFWTDFFRLNFTQFFPDDSFSYDLFCLFQCILSKTWQSAFVSQKYKIAGHSRFTGIRKVENQFARISRLRK